MKSYMCRYCIYRYIHRGKSTGCLLSWSFVMKKPSFRHSEKVCDVCLSAFDPQNGSHSLLRLGSSKAATASSQLQKFLRGRRCRGASKGFSIQHLLHHTGPDHTAAVEGRDVLAAQLFPLDSSRDRLVPLKVEVPALFGGLHVHAEEPLEVLLQLLVVHGTKQVTPNHRRLGLNVLLLPLQQPMITCSPHHRHVPFEYKQGLMREIKSTRTNGR